MTWYNGPALLKRTLTSNKCVTMISLKFQKPTSPRLHCEEVCSAPSFFSASSLHSENPPFCPRTWSPPATSSFFRVRGAQSLQVAPLLPPPITWVQLTHQDAHPLLSLSNISMFQTWCRVLHLIPKIVLYSRHSYCYCITRKLRWERPVARPSIAYMEEASPFLPLCSLFLREVAWK